MSTRSRVLFSLIVLTLVFAPTALSDSIVIDGQLYQDVLVYKSETNYYIKVPQEGRVFSKAVEEIDESTVKINDDAFYRDKLRAQYDRVKESGVAEGVASTKPVDPAFAAAATAKRPSLDSSALLNSGAAGAAGGLGMSRKEVRQMLGNFGMQFSNGPNVQGHPSIIANSPGGSIQLVGSPETLMGVIIKVTGPPQMLQQVRSQSQMLLTQAGPEVAGQLNQMFTQLDRTGSYQASHDGVDVKMRQTVNGQNANLEMSFMASG